MANKCPVCHGTGEIDSRIHLVPFGSERTKCGKARPGRRRRTASEDDSTCADCLQVLAAETAAQNTIARTTGAVG